MTSTVVVEELCSLKLPFLCAREGNKGILTNCADTSRVVASLPFLNVWCSPQSSVEHFNQEDSAHSCDPSDVEEAPSFPSEAYDALREWRQEVPEQTIRAISRITPTLVILRIRRSQR